MSHLSWTSQRLALSLIALLRTWPCPQGSIPAPCISALYLASPLPHLSSPLSSHLLAPIPNSLRQHPQTPYIELSPTPLLLPYLRVRPWPWRWALWDSCKGRPSLSQLSWMGREPLAVQTIRTSSPGRLSSISGPSVSCSMVGGTAGGENRDQKCWKQVLGGGARDQTPLPQTPGAPDGRLIPTGPMSGQDPQGEGHCFGAPHSPSTCSVRSLESSPAMLCAEQA